MRNRAFGTEGWDEVHVLKATMHALNQVYRSPVALGDARYWPSATSLHTPSTDLALPPYTHPVLTPVNTPILTSHYMSLPTRCAHNGPQASCAGRSAQLSMKTASDGSAPTCYPRSFFLLLLFFLLCNGCSVLDYILGQYWVSRSARETAQRP